MKDDKLYLIHILESIDLILQYTSEGRDFFFKDKKTQDAVIRNLEVIGEAAKRISDNIRNITPSVKWKRIAGLRDVLIHQYEGVDLDKLWAIVESELPSLKKTLMELP